MTRLTRSRLKLQGQIRVLSAEGRMSAWVLGLLPFAMLVLMSLTNPQYVSLLWTDPLGISMLWSAGGAIALGAFWMRHVVRIRV